MAVTFAPFYLFGRYSVFHSLTNGVTKQDSTTRATHSTQHSLMKLSLASQNFDFLLPHLIGPASSVSYKTTLAYHVRIYSCQTLFIRNPIKLRFNLNSFLWMKQGQYFSVWSSKALKCLLNQRSHIQDSFIDDYVFQDLTVFTHNTRGQIRLLQIKCLPLKLSRYFNFLLTGKYNLSLSYEIKIDIPFPKQVSEIMMYLSLLSCKDRMCNWNISYIQNLNYCIFPQITFLSPTHNF